MGFIHAGSWRRLLLVTGLFVLLVTGRAQAQTTPSVALALIGITHSIARANFRANDQINYGDCLDDDRVSFPLTLTNRGAYLLEVWAGLGGLDCESVAARTSSTNLGCWKLHSDVPTADLTTLVIGVRDFVAGYTSLVANPATTTNPDAGPLNPGPEACAEPISAALPSPISLEMHFMLIDPSTESVVGSDATWSPKVKLTGPPPPDELTTAIGAKRLVVHFAYHNEPADQTINGFEFYCDPATGTAALVDAGPSAVACDGPPSSVLLPGSTTVDGAHGCGSAGLTATSGTITGLVNDLPYHVAMAAADNFQNIGPLSAVTCGVPVAHPPGENDESVKACSFSAQRAPGRGSLALLVLTLIGWRRARRRARAHRAAGSARPQSSRSWRGYRRGTPSIPERA